MHKAKYIFVAISLSMLVACGTLDTIKNKQRSYELNLAEEAYSAAVRWGQYPLALEYLREKEEPTGDINDELLENIRVTSYRKMAGSMSDDELEARYTVRITFHHVESVAIKEIVDQQLWWYDELNKRWFKDGGLPDFASAYN